MALSVMKVPFVETLAAWGDHPALVSGRLSDGRIHAGSIALGLLVWTTQRQAVGLLASRRLRPADGLPAVTAHRVAHNA